MSDLTFNPRLPAHCNMDDRVAAQCLINELLAAECTITINDGEEDCLEKSSNLNEILEAMSSTGWDILTPFDKDGNETGWFNLIYENGSEGEPTVSYTHLTLPTKRIV